MTVSDGDEVSDPASGFEQEVHFTTYDVEREAPSLALVEAIAGAKGTDSFALDPVGNAVELDALDTVLDSPVGDHVVEVTVEALGVRATIDSEGTVVAQRTDNGAQGGVLDDE